MIAKAARKYERRGVITLGTEEEGGGIGGWGALICQQIPKTTEGQNTLGLLQL